ncbi:MAG: CHASE2 domain-containing protein, partial [Ideonella sp.]
MTPFERLGQWLAPLRRRWRAPAGVTVVSPHSSPFGLVWVPLLALAIGGALALSPLSARLSSTLYDLSIRAVAQPAHFDDVVVIDIDDASLRDLRPRLGGWPYSRDTFALLISFLRDVGAGPIALNLVFSEPRDGDETLSRTLGERPDVVLAAVGQQRGGGADLRSEPLRRRIAMASAPGLPSAHWAEMVMPDDVLLSTLARAAIVGAVGVVSTQLDDDGLLRRLSLLHEADGLVYPSMALAPRLLALAGSADRLTRDADSVSLGQQRWPVNSAGQVTLILPNNRDAVPRLAFSSVMETALGIRDRAALQAVLQGRTVFIGSSAFLADDVVTPLGRVSGTGLLACAHAALGRNLVLAPPAPWLAAAFAAIALSPSLLVWLRRRPLLRDDFLSSLSALVLVIAGGLAMLVHGRIEVEFLLPLVIVAGGFLIATLLQLRWVGLVNRQLRIERAMAEAANQAKSEFLANMSHEIRTPMNALLGVAELLQRTPLNDEQQRYVSVFQRSGQTLFELINDLLDLSKIEAGRLELDPEPFSLHRLLSDQHEL